jgi:DNA invertase Pin-like site-specific DNA recombinase
MSSELVKPHHLERRAVIYVRQSTQHQVLTNQESLRLQYALRQRARELGWRDADIEVVDCDLGMSGATAVLRQGFNSPLTKSVLLDSVAAWPLRISFRWRLVGSGLGSRTWW